MRRNLCLALIGLTWLACAVPAADTAFDAPGNFNPLVPGYFADPTLKRFGDLYYLYATTDGNGGGRGPATVWVSRDFVRWVLVPMNWPTTPHYWAPDVVQRPDGRYYLFYNQPCNTYAGVSPSPVGPWTPLTPGDGLVIPDRLVENVITLDTQLFEDRDGTLFGYWGTWGIFPNSGCGVGVFHADMKSFARLAMIPNTQVKDFFEAPLMIERNGVYYLTYSSGSCHDASYRVQYATSDRADGTFTMGPNNPILESNADRTIHGPGHHSILSEGDEHLIIYHRHDLPFTPNGMHRQVCADRLVFERDGVIRAVEPTHRGVGPRADAVRSADLARGATVTASSHYRDTLRKHEYRPAYAVDDNNATLWRAGDNRPGHWLQLDLGQPQAIGRVETQFEYGTWYYQYLIEHSRDGQQWQVLADRRQNTRWGSPLVDPANCTARYLRLTVTGTELPGLFAAVWNLRVYADASDDPLLALADQGFVQASRECPFSPPDARAALGGQRSAEPLIQLDVAELQLGAPLAAWSNRGSLGGEFRRVEGQPVVGMAGGRKALRFSGRDLLTASFPAPRALAGNSSFTVAAWVNNPEIAESECLVSWAGRGGPDATTAQFNYGSHGAFGAVGHWGFADMGFRDAPPEAGAWHHLAVVFDGVVERIYVDGQLNNAAAKMLLMHEGRPIHVGASAPGTEYFDGYLASLCVFDRALDEAQVRQLAADAPEAEVLIHADAARLDEGPLAAWANRGAWGGEFQPLGPPPVVSDVDQRIAVMFTADEVLQWTTDAPVALQDFSLLIGLWNATGQAERCVVELVGAAGQAAARLSSPPAAGWHQLAYVYRNGRGTAYLDGKPRPQPLPAVPETITAFRLVGDRSLPGALARVQCFRRALADQELAQLYAAWQQERQVPEPHPAAFAAEPAALTPRMILMTAQPGRSALGPVEYRFTETSGNAGGSSSGWSRSPSFLDDGLQPDTGYRYTVRVRDLQGNVTAASAPREVRTDAADFQEWVADFSTPRDFLAAGAGGTIWDRCLAADDSSFPEAIRIDEGRLQLQSRGTVWDGGPRRGAFLFKLVSGDFVAQATVADYAGLATRRVPGNNDGGLMARVPDLGDAGPGEDLVQLNFFPIWNQGNMVTSLDGGARPQQGNRRAWDAHRHLQLIRQGPRFHLRTSADGQRWEELPGSPLQRDDMAGLPLQVGLYHASYGSDSSFITFDAFRLTAGHSTAAPPP